MTPSGSNVKDHFKYIVESDQTLKLHLTTKNWNPVILAWYLNIGAKA